MEGMVEIFDMLLATTSRFRALKLKPEEFVCLKAIVLLNSGEARRHPQVSAKSVPPNFSGTSLESGVLLERAGLINMADSRYHGNMRQHRQLCLSQRFRYSYLDTEVFFLQTFPHL